MKDDDRQPEGVSVHAGFPNPAADKRLSGLDLNQLLIKNTVSTFMFRLEGRDWEKLGIFNNDIVLVDRAIDPKPNDLVVWWSEHTDGFAISKNRSAPEGVTVWGVVTAVVHQFRKGKDA
jgi:DNA polymerase V